MPFAADYAAAVSPLLSISLPPCLFFVALPALLIGATLCGAADAMLPIFATLLFALSFFTPAVFADFARPPSAATLALHLLYTIYAPR